MKLLYHLVWKKSIELVTEIYSITANFPNEEKYGIVSQIRRAAISVPSNIAEGCARVSDKESSRFVNIAIGSIAELETQIIISQKLGYVDNIEQLIVKIKRINALVVGLRKFLDKPVS